MISYPSARVTLRMNFQDDPDTYYLVDALPKYVKAEINSYQQADEFEVKLDYNVFPIDPRSIKSCGIGVWIGCTKTFSELVDNDPDNCMITGFVDEFDLNFEQEDQVITLKGRDFTGVLLDNKWFHGNIPLDMPLDETVRWILDHDPAFENIEVINKTGGELPILSGIKLRSYEEHTPDKEDSYWDIIYDLVLQCGLICYIQLDMLIINKAKSVYDNSNLTNFVYGMNLNQLRFTKKFGKNQGLNIEVRSYDSTTKQTLIARYPDPPIDKKQMVIPSMTSDLKKQTIHTKPPKPVKKTTKKNGTPKATKAPAAPAEHYEVTTFVVNNISDIEQLKVIAENIWNQLYRKEVEGEFTTFDLTGIDNENDLTKLRNGDAVVLTIGDEFKKIVNNMPYPQKLDFLINNGFDPKVAKEIVDSPGKLDKVFYIQKVRHEFQNTEGYTLSVDFINYLNMPGVIPNNGN